MIIIISMHSEKTEAVRRYPPRNLIDFACASGFAKQIHWFKCEKEKDFVIVNEGSAQFVPVKVFCIKTDEEPVKRHAWVSSFCMVK